MMWYGWYPRKNLFWISRRYRRGLGRRVVLLGRVLTRLVIGLLGALLRGLVRCRRIFGRRLRVVIMMSSLVLVLIMFIGTLVRIRRRRLLGGLLVLLEIGVLLLPRMIVLFVVSIFVRLFVIGSILSTRMVLRFLKRSRIVLGGREVVADWNRSWVPTLLRMRRSFLLCRARLWYWLWHSWRW